MRKRVRAKKLLLLRPRGPSGDRRTTRRGTKTNRTWKRCSSSRFILHPDLDHASTWIMCIMTMSLKALLDLVGRVALQKWCQCPRLPLNAANDLSRCKRCYVKGGEGLRGCQTVRESVVKLTMRRSWRGVPTGLGACSSNTRSPLALVSLVICPAASLWTRGSLNKYQGWNMCRKRRPPARRSQARKDDELRNGFPGQFERCRYWRAPGEDPNSMKDNGWS